MRKFQYGDKVIVKGGFYKDLEGYVIGYNGKDNRFDCKLYVDHIDYLETEYAYVTIDADYLKKVV